MEPAGLAGNAARSAAQSLLRHAGSFQARMILRVDISVFLSNVVAVVLRP
jgi:hypothetical protein